MRRKTINLVAALSLILLTITASAIPNPTPLSAGGGYPPVTVSLIPSSKTVQPGESFTIDVMLDMQANSHAISFVKFVWSFKDHVLEATAISLNPPFQFIEQLPTGPGVGTIGFSAGAGLNAVQNSMTVATLSFRADNLSDRSTQINWDIAQALSLSSWDSATENVVGSTSAAGVCVGTCWPPPYSIGGRMSDANTNAISGVTVNIAGPTIRSTTTDTYGDYLLRDLTAGSYTITPSKSGYTFSPASRTVVVPPDATTVDFIGTPETSSQTIDLEVTNIQSPTPPICAGSAYDFSAVIRNNGSAASGVFSIRWNSDGHYDDGGHNSIPAGATDGHGHLWQNLPPGQHTLTFIADFSDQIPETNENNNQQTITFTAIDCSLGDTTPPAAVTNLRSGPDTINAGGVSLSWTAPGDDGSGGGPAAQYDIRYSNRPIDNNNWASALQVDNEPGPGSPATSQTMFIPALQTGTRWYFAMRTADEAGNWSGVSNRPSIQDIGFRPQVDGYQFCNGPTSRSCDPGWGEYPFGAANGDYTMSDMRRMYGDGAVCEKTIGNICFPKWEALQWNIAINKMLNEGHCGGFTTTSLRFYKNIDDPINFQTGAKSTHELQLSNARRNIAYYQWLEAGTPVTSAREEGRKKTPAQILGELRSAMSGSISNPPSLILYGAEGIHAVAPYAIQERDDGVWWVYVYDNNHPDDANRYVEINTTTHINTWKYDFGIRRGGRDVVWSGTANSKSMSMVPLSTYEEPPSCPWCIVPSIQSGSSEGQIVLNGQGHLLISDAQGRRLGYVGNQFVTDIPGAFGSALPGGLGIPLEPIYHVPLGGVYTILLDGQTLTQPEDVAVNQIGPGYAISVEDIPLRPTSKDQLTLASDGTQVTYHANEPIAATLTLALDHANTGYRLQIKGVDIGANQAVTAKVNTTEGMLIFDNARASGGTHNLEINRVGTAGIQTFFHANINISPGDTHSIKYGAWDGSGSMVLQIDRGSNGTIDQTIRLENQRRPIYLPVVLR
jgi:CARDB/Carboxypeptidase regulatory-like domain